MDNLKGKPIAKSFDGEVIGTDDKENCWSLNEKTDSPRNQLKMRDFSKLVTKNVNIR
jgi:hypothetical protein